MQNRPTIDWNDFVARLTAVATRWMVDRSADKEDLMIAGKSPSDLAKIATVVVLEKYHETGPAKDSEELLRIARKVMRRDFLDLLRSSAYKTSERIADIADSHDDQKSLGANDRQFEKIETVDYFLALAGDDKDLQDFVTAIVELREFKREDLAELLNKTPQQVTNMQRKLQYRYVRREKLTSKQKLRN